MAYRKPAFMVAHPIAEAGFSAVTDPNGELTADEIRSLIDYRTGELATYSFAGDRAVRVNLGTTKVFDHVIIPAGHGLAGADISVFMDTVATFDGPPTQRLAKTIGANSTSVIDESLTLSFVARQHWQLSIAGTALVPWSLGEFWLGTKRVLGVGESAYVDPSFTSQYSIPRTTLELPTRTASVQLAPARREFSLLVRRLDPEGLDYALLDDVMLAGELRPFWYWPPDSLDPGPYLVELSEQPKRSQGFSRPSKQMSYTVELKMREVVG